MLSALLLLIGCDNTEKLTVKGKISGAAGDTLSITQLVNNVLTVVDKQPLNASGSFKFQLPVSEYPPYYFLQLEDGSRVVVMRDSSNVIEVTATAPNFAELAIQGSEVSVIINETTSRVDQLRADYTKYLRDVSEMSEEDAAVAKELLLDKIQEVKEHIGAQIFKTPFSYYSYYALYQRLSDDALLFSPYSDEDYKYFASTATAYDLMHKGDPRTTALYEMVEGVLKERRVAKLQQMVTEAPAGIPDIVMNDVKGKEKKLSDLKGKVVILNFWGSKSQECRMWNREFKRLYGQYKRKGLDVFQVSADKSKILWEDAIIQDGLTWTNVCDFEEGASHALRIYNVRVVPTTFLISREGEIIGKYEDPTKLEEAIKKAL